MASNLANTAEQQTANGVVRSMTGFALRRRATEWGELTASLRSVNHRGLDFHFHTGYDLLIFENDLRALLKRHLARGHVEVRLSLTRTRRESPALLRTEVLAAYVAGLREAAAQLGVPGEPDLNALMTLPGVIREETPAAGEPPAAFVGEVLALAGAVLEEFNEHRAREGAALCTEMLRLAGEIARWTEEFAEIRRDALPHFVNRLQTKLRELLDGASVSEQRLAEEAALLADRSDVEEELTRLRVHTTELERILRDGGEVGKRLDFLLQEMNREANTALAKSAGAGEPGLRMTGLGLLIKANIERIREQALNLE